MTTEVSSVKSEKTHVYSNIMISKKRTAPPMQERVILLCSPMLLPVSYSLYCSTPFSVSLRYLVMIWNVSRALDFDLKKQYYIYKLPSFFMSQ